MQPKVTPPIVNPLVATHDHYNGGIMISKVFAAEIGQRLREILPPGFEVWIDDTTVWVGDSGKPESGTGVETVDRDQRDYHVNVFELVALNVLDHVQDYVVHCIRERWPAFVTADRSIGMASPYARLDDGILRMGYGTEDEPVVVLRPVLVQSRTE